MIISIIIFLYSIFFINSSFQEYTINYEPYYTYKDLFMQQNMKRVCYYGIPIPSSWDRTLKDLKPEQIDPFLCTHIIIGFAQIQNNTIVPKRPSDLEIYKKILALKEVNPELKVMLSLNAGFQELAKKKESIDIFAFNAAQFLRDHQLDGLDLDWEFPAWPFSFKTRYEKKRFTYLVTQLWNSLKLSSHPPLLFSIAVASPLTIVRNSYEVDKLAQNVDFINLMGYDFRIYVSYFPFTGYNSPLQKAEFDIGFFATLNINWAAYNWVSKGTPKEKLVVGIPTYGRTWKLLSFLWHKLGAPAVGPGMNGGYVSYPEAVEFLKDGAVRVFDEYSRVPYSYLGRNWVSYEDTESIREKALWVKNNSFAGVMVWNLNCDDFLGNATGTKFELINVIKDVLED